MTQDFDKVEIDTATKQSDQITLFDFIAKSVAEFCKDRNISQKLPLGFTFSFPVRQTSLTSGELIRWTKDFTAKDCVGHDVVKMLRDAFVRRGVSRVFVTQLCELQDSSVLLPFLCVHSPLPPLSHSLYPLSLSLSRFNPSPHSPFCLHVPPARI